MAIIGAFRKGLTEDMDISDLLRKVDLVPDHDGKLGLSPQQDDIWKPRS
jgi:hypothetical protein